MAEGSPIASRQAVLAVLQQAIASGQHLCCVSGPAGSGKTSLLHSLRQAYDRGLVIAMTAPEPGNLLAAVLSALDLGGDGDNPIAARRRLALRLTLAEEQRQAIVVLIDAAHTLSRADADILFHFFPPGHSAVVLAGEGSPVEWPACGALDDDQMAAISYVLEPLSLEETAAFVRERLKDSARLTQLLDSNACEDIRRRGGAHPGGIATVCANLLAQFPTGDVTPPAAAAAPAHAPPKPAVVREAAMDERVPRDAMAMAPERTGAAQHAADRAIPAARGVKRRMSQPFARHSRPWRTLAIALMVVACTTLAVVLLVPDRIVPNGPEPARITRNPSNDTLVSASSPQPEMRQPRPDGLHEAEPPAPVESTARPLPTPNPIPDTYWQRAAERPTDEPAMTGIDTPGPHTAPNPAPATAAIPERFPERAQPAPLPTQPGTPTREAATAAADAALAASRAPPALSADERTALGRLYAERAEHEIRTAQWAAAAVSMERGLAADPRNRRLLNLRVMLRSSNR